MCAPTHTVISYFVQNTYKTHVVVFPLCQAPDSDDEQEDLEIRPTDNLLVAAKTQDEVSQLDVYVYDAAEANLYVHHDFLLPAMPLCLEWLDFHPPSATASLESQSNSSRPEKGSYIAVGTLDPDIEIWSLDVVDGLYPDAILGAPKGAGDAHQTPLEATITSLSISDAPSLAAATRGGNNKKKKKPKKSKSQPLPPAANASYHTDSILSLSWNKSHRSLLASSSADKTVKLWDLSRPSASPALRSYDFHTDKVQAVQWNQASPTTLLSGAMDGTLKVFDSRAPDAQTTVQLASDIECVKWSQWNGGAEFLVSTESGTVESYDSRTMARLWTLAAHDKAVTSMDYSDVLNGFLVTGSADHTVKLWQVAPGNISCLTSRDLGLVRSCLSLSLSVSLLTEPHIAGQRLLIQLLPRRPHRARRGRVQRQAADLGHSVERRRAQGLWRAAQGAGQTAQHHPRGRRHRRSGGPQRGRVGRRGLIDRSIVVVLCNLFHHAIWVFVTFHGPRFKSSP